MRLVTDTGKHARYKVLFDSLMGRIPDPITYEGAEPVLRFLDSIRYGDTYGLQYYQILYNKIIQSYYPELRGKAGKTVVFKYQSEDVTTYLDLDKKITYLPNFIRRCVFKKLITMLLMNNVIGICNFFKVVEIENFTFTDNLILMISEGMREYELRYLLNELNTIPTSTSEIYDASYRLPIIALFSQYMPKEIAQQLIDDIDKYPSVKKHINIDGLKNMILILTKTVTLANISEEVLFLDDLKKIGDVALIHLINFFRCIDKPLYSYVFLKNYFEYFAKLCLNNKSKIFSLLVPPLVNNIFFKKKLRLTFQLSAVTKPLLGKLASCVLVLLSKGVNVEKHKEHYHYMLRIIYTGSSILEINNILRKGHKLFVLPQARKKYATRNVSADNYSVLDKLSKYYYFNPTVGFNNPNGLYGKAFAEIHNSAKREILIAIGKKINTKRAPKIDGSVSRRALIDIALQKSSKASDKEEYTFLLEHMDALECIFETVSFHAHDLKHFFGALPDDFIDQLRKTYNYFLSELDEKHHKDIDPIVLITYTTDFMSEHYYRAKFSSQKEQQEFWKRRLDAFRIWHENESCKHKISTSILSQIDAIVELCPTRSAKDVADFLSILYNFKQLHFDTYIQCKHYESRLFKLSFEQYLPTPYSTLKKMLNDIKELSKEHKLSDVSVKIKILDFFQSNKAKKNFREKLKKFMTKVFKSPDNEAELLKSIEAEHNTNRHARQFLTFIMKDETVDGYKKWNTLPVMSQSRILRVLISYKTGYLYRFQSLMPFAQSLFTRKSDKLSIRDKLSIEAPIFKKYLNCIKSPTTKKYFVRLVNQLRDSHKDVVENYFKSLLKITDEEAFKATAVGISKFAHFFYSNKQLSVEDKKNMLNLDWDSILLLIKATYLPVNKPQFHRIVFDFISHVQVQVNTAAKRAAPDSLDCDAKKIRMS